MASATRKTVEIEKMIPTKVNEERVILQLTPEEADELLAFLRAKHWPSALSYPLTSGVLSALANQASEDRPIEVGDKVRITGVSRGGDGYLNKVGTLKNIDQDDPALPFLVDLPDSDWTWAKSVERVND